MPLVSGSIWLDDCMDRRPLQPTRPRPVSFPLEYYPSIALTVDVSILNGWLAFQSFQRLTPPRRLPEAVTMPVGVSLDDFITQAHWHVPDQPRQRPRQARPQPESFSDGGQQWGLITWVFRDEPRLFRRAPFRPSGVTDGLPQPYFEDILVSWLGAEPVRARPPQRQRPPDFPGVVQPPAIDDQLLAWLGVDPTRRRPAPTRPVPSQPDASGQPILDDQLLGWLGLQPGRARATPAPLRPADLSWVMIEEITPSAMRWWTEGGPAKRVVTWHPREQDPRILGIATGALVVAGPYYVTAGQVFSPGPTTGDVKRAT